jgi:SAM-dependent methyltransferase/predicted metal-dependent enzyme (double-stranded beta helix superfamily)
MDITLSSNFKQLIDNIENDTQINSDRLAIWMQQAQLSADDLMQWSDFNHPKTDSYGRKLVFDNKYFEVMIMSWQPEDFSAIHDHGYTQWGAVQVFGAAEHAIFNCKNGKIYTTLRENLQAGDIRTVSHDLVHQLGNPSSSEQFLSLHIYGHSEPHENITGDAQLFDLYHKEVHRVNGGVFFALPEEEIKVREQTLHPNYSTWLRHTTELLKRLLKHPQSEQTPYLQQRNELQQDLFSVEHWSELLQEINYCIDNNGFIHDLAMWKVLNWELKYASKLQQKLTQNDSKKDSFHTYALNYNEIVGTPCLVQFMQKYLDFFFAQCEKKPQTVLSVGCGTGLTEAYMQKHFGIEDLLGIDISQAMVAEALPHIQAEVGDITYYQTEKQWDVVYTGLNVLQYLKCDDLPKAIENIYHAVKSGGHFIGDFVSPDHIRSYLNFIQNDDKTVISLRTPKLIEKQHRTYQSSEIINISIIDGQLRINYEGVHERYLPSIKKVKELFQIVGFNVQLYDALSLEKLHSEAETSPSTRYFMIAHKT